MQYSIAKVLICRSQESVACRSQTGDCKAFVKIGTRMLAPPNKPCKFGAECNHQNYQANNDLSYYGSLYFSEKHPNCCGIATSRWVSFSASASKSFLGTKSSYATVKTYQGQAQQDQLVDSQFPQEQWSHRLVCFWACHLDEFHSHAHMHCSPQLPTLCQASQLKFSTLLNHNFWWQCVKSRGPIWLKLSSKPGKIRKKAHS